MNYSEETEEYRRRRREKIAVIVIISALVLFTSLEVNLIRVSHKLPFVNSIFFFGLMNLNVVLIMLLLFLVFRNSVKLILDQKKGKIGSRLRTRLVVIFLLFSIIPTLLLFTICAFYIKSSFDKWFSARIESTLQRSIEVVRNFYENAEKNAQHFSRKVAMAFPEKTPANFEIEKFLQTARMDYGLDAVEFYSDPFSVRVISVAANKQNFIPPISLETLKRAFGGANECKIQDVGSGELVRCSAFIGIGKGVLFVDYFIPHGLASQLSEINLTYSDYKSDNPFNYPVKSAYFGILLMVTLLILFSAIWTGFYIAKRLTVPIEELSKGTEEIAQGNLDYIIPSMGKDELSKLIGSFNQMTQDLRQNKKDIELTHEHLKSVNSELEKRRKYIEVLLESVQSGVVSLDEHGRVSMMNEAASRLLRKPVPELIGKAYWALIPEEHRSEFREVLLAVYGNSRPVRREIRIKVSDSDSVTLLMTFSVLRDENRIHGLRGLEGKRAREQHCCQCRHLSRR